MHFLLFLLLTATGFLTTSLPAQNPCSYSVTFSVSNSESFLGHVWVEFSQDTSQKKVGFYMVGLQDETNRQADVDYTFSVSKAEYGAALDIVDLYEDYPYIFGLHDCRSFASDVAKALNLKVPSAGVKSPAEWLGALVHLN